MEIKRKISRRLLSVSHCLTHGVAGGATWRPELHSTQELTYACRLGTGSKKTQQTPPQRAVRRPPGVLQLHLCFQSTGVRFFSMGKENGAVSKMLPSKNIVTMPRLFHTSFSACLKPVRAPSAKVSLAFPSPLLTFSSPQILSERVQAFVNLKRFVLCFFWCERLKPPCVFNGNVPL